MHERASNRLARGLAAALVAVTTLLLAANAGPAEGDPAPAHEPLTRQAPAQPSPLAE
ncbi:MULTISPECIES: hypothetical protein [unclassified Streptomyces]|uniref:hypothetical protein n=1 Tax=unclassified Streptomyces TaxID=2593676 RepID=UPI003D70302B